MVCFGYLDSRFTRSEVMILLKLLAEKDIFAMNICGGWKVDQWIRGVR